MREVPAIQFLFAEISVADAVMADQSGVTAISEIASSNSPASGKFKISGKFKMVDGDASPNISPLLSPVEFANGF